MSGTDGQILAICDQLDEGRKQRLMDYLHVLLDEHRAEQCAVVN